MSDNLKLASVNSKNIETDKKEVKFQREERYKVNNQLSVSLTLKFDGLVLPAELVDISEFGCCIRIAHTDTISVNTIFEEFDIRVEEQCIYSGPAKVANERIDGTRLSLGIEFCGQSVDVTRLRSINQTRENRKELASITDSFASRLEIDQEFKVLCSDFVYLLNNIKNTLAREQEKISDVAVSQKHKSSLEEQIITVAVSLYTKLIQDFFKEFTILTSDINTDKGSLYKSYFKSIFHPIFLSAPFIQRAFEKPLGYAGDYGLMLMFYEYEDFGTDLFGKFMHRYACNEPSALANKNRVDFIGELIGDKCRKTLGDFKVSSIACGPAREIRYFLEDVESSDQKITAILIDQETDALNYALRNIRENLGKNTNVKVKCLSEDAVFGVIKKSKFTEEIVDSDIIVSAGLFDYLSDRVAKKLIEALYKNLSSDGSLLIGNVSLDSPDKFSMNYLMDWNLFYRTESDLLRLAPEYCVKNKKARVISEPLGLNLFLRIDK